MELNVLKYLPVSLASLSQTNEGFHFKTNLYFKPNKRTYLSNLRRYILTLRLNYLFSVARYFKILMWRIFARKKNFRCSQTWLRDPNVCDVKN